MGYFLRIIDLISIGISVYYYGTQWNVHVPSFKYKKEVEANEIIKIEIFC